MAFLAKANARFPAATAYISEIIKKNLPFRSIIFVKIEPFTEFLISAGNNLTFLKF